MIVVIILCMGFVTSCSKKEKIVTMLEKRDAISDEAVAANRKVFEENLPFGNDERQINVLIRSLLAIDGIGNIEEVVLVEHHETGYELLIVDEFKETYQVGLSYFGYLAQVRKGVRGGEVIFNAL